MSKRIFQAILLQNLDMDASYIEIPFNVEAAYGAKRVKVKALLNGVEYRGSIVRMQTTCHILGIPKGTRQKTGATFGDIIEVELEKDEDERILVVPDDVKEQFNESAWTAFQNLSYSQQKKHLLTIESAKRESTRAQRISKIFTEMEDMGKK